MYRLLLLLLHQSNNGLFRTSWVPER